MKEKYETPSVIIVKGEVHTTDIIVNSNGTGGSKSFEELWGTMSIEGSF